ncbi:MAG: hypothetical protein P4L92_04145 [Rudaea sp.]|nr:hypothetical protein [Rudaea sp.]
MTSTAKEAAIAAFSDGVDEANRREQGDFDGLLGQVRDDASPLLAGILTELRSVLLEHYPNKAKARALLEEREPHDHEPGEGYRNITPIDPELALAIRLLNMIRSTHRCDEDRFLTILLGKSGKRDAKLQAAKRKPRQPEITKWINAQLDRDSGAKSPELWATAPEWLTDTIEIDRFRKRVTAERKKRR